MLRETSLDELPQLLNILRGDMSLVGPAAGTTPLRRTVLAEHPALRSTPPGPGRAHRAGRRSHGLRGDTSIADRARFDNYYIENWSLWLDVKILLRTVAEVVLARGR